LHYLQPIDVGVVIGEGRGGGRMDNAVYLVLAIALGWCVGYLSCLVLEVERRNEDHADD
jgi:hypothetical protein